MSKECNSQQMNNKVMIKYDYNEIHKTGITAYTERKKERKKEKMKGMKEERNIE